MTKSSIAKFAIPGQDITAGITAAFAGKPFVCVDRSERLMDSRKIVAHLYGPGRTQPEVARLPSLTLPNPLVPGAYNLNVRLQGELEPARFDFTVTTPPQPPVVTDAGGQADDTDGTPHPATLPSHLLKAIVDGAAVEPDARIIRLDGSTVTMADMVKVWGTKATRAWFSVVPGGSPSKAAVDKLVKWCKACGVGTLLICCTPAKGGAVIPTEMQTAAWFTALASMLRNCGIRVVIELVNEPNLADYWKPRSLSLLLKVFVKPAELVLRQAGIEVVGPSPTGSVGTLRELVNGGLLCDAYGFHTYRPKADQLPAMLAELLKITSTKPLDITEFNTFNGPHYRAWCVLQDHPELKTDVDLRQFDRLAEFPAMSPDDLIADQLSQWAILQKSKTVRFVFYYSVIVDKETTTGPLALLKRDAAGAIRETLFSRDFWAKAA